MNLGKYEIQEELGQGGFGTVYKALDRSLKRTVAIKVLHPNLVNDQTFLGRFRQEAQITAQLNHANLVHIYNYGESEGHYYIVMSYMPGGSLKERIKNEGAFSKEAALAVIEQIADGLEYSHKHHVIHRDLKPGNILFDEEGKACISDLGFAKLLRSDASASMSASGGIVGTPAYMAPEIWRGTAASPATDIYSLACILVEMLTGERLFGGESTPEVMLKHFEPLHLPEGLPEEWKAVLEAALEKKPEDRIQSVAEFLEQLKQAGLSSQKYTNQPLGGDQGESLSDKKREASPENEPLEVKQILQRSLDSHPVEMVFESENEFRKKRENETKDAVNATHVIGEEAGFIEADSGKSKTQKNQNLENSESSLSSRSRKEKSNSKSGLILGFALLAIILGVITYQIVKSNSKTEYADVKVAVTATATNPAVIPTKAATKTPAPPANEAVLGIGSTQTRNKDKMEQVYVPEGNFIMGSDDVEWAKPVRTVYLDAYWIDKYEVTNGQYQQCVSRGKCTEPYRSDYEPWSNYYGNLSFDDYPVVYVDWNQAKAYCEWAGGDLPTEAQWEKAARGEDGRKYPWGNTEPNSSLVVFDTNDNESVGSKPDGASPYGAMDMMGNVWEWVNDEFEGYYDPNDTYNPQGPNPSSLKVLRGGGWFNSSDEVHSAVRNFDYRNVQLNSMGFRCASKP